MMRPIVHVIDASDLGWEVAFRREEEGNRYYAQLERVREILGGISSDTDEAGLVVALERIADVTGLGAESMFGREPSA